MTDVLTSVQAESEAEASQVCVLLEAIDLLDSTLGREPVLERLLRGDRHGDRDRTTRTRESHRDVIGQGFEGPVRGSASVCGDRCIGL